jgi:hypothetical protein
MSTSMNNDRLRRGANVLLAVTQIAGGYFSRLTGLGEPIDRQSARFETPLTPAGYTFAIWGVIFLGCLAYAIYQARPDRPGDRTLRRTGWFTAGAFLGNTFWEIECQLHGMTWLSVGIILFTLVMSGLAFRELVRVRILLTTGEYWCGLAPVGLLTGWISVATFANISQACQAGGLGSLGLSPNNFAIIMIVLAGLLGLAVTLWSHGEQSYAYAVAWGLIGVAVANHGKWENPNGTLTACLMAGLVFFGQFTDQIRIQLRPDSSAIRRPAAGRSANSSPAERQLQERLPRSGGEFPLPDAPIPCLGELT